MSEIRKHSPEAWEIASRYSGVLASETRDLAAEIDEELNRLRAERDAALNQLVKARTSLEEFKRWCRTDISRKTWGALRALETALTDEMRCDPDEGLPTAEDVRGILAPVTSAQRGDTE